MACHPVQTQIANSSNNAFLLKADWKRTFSQSSCCLQFPPLPASSPGPTTICHPEAGPWGQENGMHAASLSRALFHPTVDLPATECFSVKWFLSPKQSAPQQLTQRSWQYRVPPAPQFAAGTFAQPYGLRKASERQAGSYSQHHALVLASYCTKWTTHICYLQTVFHMMEQLLARSFLISVSFSKFVLLGICDARFSPRLELERFRFLCILLTEARVVTWKTSRTLSSDTLEEHSA